QRGGQAGALEVGRVEVDEQRAQVADDRARARGGILQPGAVLGIGVAGGGRQGVGDADQLLYGAVVEVGGQAAAFGVGDLQRGAQQLLALGLARAQALDQRACQQIGRATCRERV